MFARKRQNVIEYYESFACVHYPFDSIHCHLSTSTWIAILCGLMLLVAIIAGLVYYYVRTLTVKDKRNPVTDL